jgi:hypothetical protein
MTHHWDEFSKSLAEESMPRRESLRRFGAVLAGAMLSPLGLATAWAAPRTDPCKAFCQCSNKWERNACLAACRNCNNGPSHLCGSCWSGYTCTNFNTVQNCGACGHSCSRPNAYAACVDGACEYECWSGTVDCNGQCIFLDRDVANCGACGNACGGSTPYCSEGECQACPPGHVLCGDSCVDLGFDSANCGACGNVCDDFTPVCEAGACVACPEGSTDCGGYCSDLMDDYNCGACGNSCVPGGFCVGGRCIADA